MKNFCKKNKYTIIVLVCFLFLVILLVQVKNIFFPQNGTAIYGERLKGIEDVKIKAQKEEAIENALLEDAAVQKANVSVKGRILNVFVTLKEDATKEAARDLTSKILEHLEEEQKKYFDIQIFLNKTNDDAAFPIIGYKHHQKDNFSFTKDR